MYLRSFFDEKLAQYAYLIGCQRTGEAIIIDPPRDYKDIAEAAKKEGLRITAVTETHIHADFVSGTRQVAHDLNAHAYLSDEGDENWKYGYADELNVTWLKDGSKFSIGNVDFEVLHTPGHTPESISFVLTDRGGGSTKPLGIFTGDFVFVGDVGRPDLLEKAAGIADTAEAGAKQMFKSVQRFKELPDYMMVWPGHGAGSACGKSLGAVPSSTVGYEKQMNWAMQENDEQKFVAKLLEDQPEAPVYFAEMKKVNKIGPDLLEERDIPTYTTSEELNEALKSDNIFLLDTRPAAIAEKTLVPGSVNIPWNKSFTNWAGWLIRYNEDMVIIADDNQHDGILHDLQSIHLDRVKAFVNPEALNGFDWNSYETISVDEFDKYKDDYYVMDVRNSTEWKDGHIPGAHHDFLGRLRQLELDRSTPVLVHCQAGARSAIAASILKTLGFEDVLNLAGGYAAYERGGNKIEK